jgi:hypothetical protein
MQPVEHIHRSCSPAFDASGFVGVFITILLPHCQMRISGRSLLYCGFTPTNFREFKHPPSREDKNLTAAD